MGSNNLDLTGALKGSDDAWSWTIRRRCTTGEQCRERIDAAGVIGNHFGDLKLTRFSLDDGPDRAGDRFRDFLQRLLLVPTGNGTVGAWTHQKIADRLF